MSVSDALSADLGGQLDRAELHLADQPAHLARVDQAGAEAPGGLRAAGHAEAQALLRRGAAVARGDVAGEEGVAGAARGDRLARLDARAAQARLAVDAAPARSSRRAAS